MKNHTAPIIAAVIGAIATISAAFIGKNVGEKDAIQQLYSQMTTVNGNNNTVTINSVDDFVAQYNKLISENETLKAQNSQYFADYTEQKNINDQLILQLNERPAVFTENLGLCIDGEDILVNENDSMVTINGIEYYSKELAENFLDKNQKMTIEDGKIYIGRVIADKKSLFEIKPMDQENIYMTDSIKDSYGNKYSNVLYTDTSFTYSNHIIYPLNRKYSLMKFTIAIDEYARLDSIGVLTIKADDEVVYISKDLNKKTEPFTEIDIPIKNCNLLTIEYAQDPSNIDCIIANAYVYN